jgi:S-DNA-T family DNA segregation ATPase FtsK/SpoIIIE
MATKTTTSRNDQSSAETTPARRFSHYCFTLLLCGAVVLAWLSLLSFHPADPPSKLLYPPPSPVHNLAGRVGAAVAWALRYYVGAGSFALLGLLSYWAWRLLRGRCVSDLPWRLLGAGLLTTAASAACYLADPTRFGPLVRSTCGVLGEATGRAMLSRFGPTGSWVIAAVVGAIGLMLAADQLVTALYSRVSRLWAGRSEMARKFAELRANRRKVAAAGAAASSAVTAPAPPRPRERAPGLADAPADPPRKAVPSRPQPDAQQDEPPQPKKTSPLSRLLPARAEKDQNPPEKPAAKKSSAGQSSPSKSSAKTTASPPARQRESSNDLPSMDLLDEPTGDYSEQAEIQAAQRKLVLQQTLDDFNVEAKVVGYMTGPVITLYEVSLAPGVKVAQVANLATDIARSLAVPGVRIVPPRFGKDTVGIEVPNLDKEIVRLKDLMTAKGEADRKMTLPLYLGKDAGGDSLVVDLARCPHMLIAGTTGSGKSVCINTIIMSLLMTRTSKDVRFILVDPKMVEMAAFEKLPHLLCPTINDMKKAEDILEWAVTKMDERYELLREAGVKNRDAYNRLKPDDLYERFKVESDDEKSRIPLNMPAYVIIIDELADLMMTSSKEVESYIIRIAQKARAVGIHLVLATQRPSANVVTGLIKSNMPCRVSFRVASGQESRIVLDSKGAEILLGQGDMLLLQPGDSSLVRAQGTFVDDSEVRAVVQSLCENGEQVFDDELVKIQSGAAGELSGEKDELFDQAVEVVLATKRGSVSLLQRRLQIGYGRASRIIDQMAEAGLLGEHKGSQARECMITIEDWEAMKAGIAADQSGDNSLNGEPTSS